MLRSYKCEGKNNKERCGTPGNWSPDTSGAGHDLHAKQVYRMIRDLREG